MRPCMMRRAGHGKGVRALRTRPKRLPTSARTQVITSAAFYLVLNSQCISYMSCGELLDFPGGMTAMVFRSFCHLTARRKMSWVCSEDILS